MDKNRLVSWGWLLGIVLWLGFAQAAGAQEPPVAQTSQTEDVPRVPGAEPEAVPPPSSRALSEWTYEELIAEGFVFEDAASAQSRAVGTLLGATAGLVLRGIGHWYVDDYPTAATLLGAQVLSLGLLGTGLVMGAWDEAESSALAESAMFLGAGLFVVSYAVDVLGTAYSDELGLPTNSLEPRRLGLQLRYIYIQEDTHDLRHLLNGELRADFRRVFGNIRTVQDVYLNMESYGAQVGWRVLQGQSNLTWAAVELEGNFQRWKGASRYDRMDAGLLLGVSLDLGDVFRHLENFAVGAHFGVGQRLLHHRPENSEESTRWVRGKAYLPMELFTHMNLTESLNARFAYSRGRNHFVRIDSHVEGLSTLEFVYKSARNLDLVFRGEFGEGFALSGALNLWFWDR